MYKNRHNIVLMVIFQLNMAGFFSLLSPDYQSLAILNTNILTGKAKTLLSFSEVSKYDYQQCTAPNYINRHPKGF